MNTPQIEATDRDQNKRARFCVPFRPNSNFLLTLGELEGAPRLGPAVLLAFHHARVAGEEAAALERTAQLGLEVSQRLGDAMTHGAGLAGQAPAGDGADYVVLGRAGGGG